MLCHMIYTMILFGLFQAASLIFPTKLLRITVYNMSAFHRIIIVLIPNRFTYTIYLLYFIASESF